MKLRLALALCLLLCAGHCGAKTLWVVLLPGTSLTDWQRSDAPHLHRILATGSVALMNTRTARTPSDHVRETPESAALTLGAGSRAAGGPEATCFLPQAVSILPNTTAGELYARRTGAAADPGAWVNVRWPRVLRENAAQGYDLHPGNLADALRRAGVPVYAGGGPLAYAVAADSDGQVIPASQSAEEGGTDCIIWDAGNDLPAADAFLGSLTARLGDGRIIVLSPTAGDQDYQRGARLCPVAVWGRGVPPGLILSASTRRAGLVTDTDVSVSVAAFFGLPVGVFPVRPFGVQAWTYLPASDAVARVGAMDTDALGQWGGMRALPLLAVFLGLWIVGATLVTTRHPGTAWTASVPPAVILAALLSTSPATLAFWLVAAMLSVPVVRPLAYASVLGVLLIGDMTLGDPLMRQSLLGYSAIEGARYYGVGNEAMGALTGSCLIVADAAWRRLTPTCRPWVWLGLAAVALLLGSPQAGAKAGGFIVAATAFGSYGWMRSGRRWDVRVACFLGLGAALILLAIAFGDAHLGGGRASHLGQGAARLAFGGVGEWADIIRRKMAMEGHLLWHSTWAVPLWGGLAALAWRAGRLPEGDRPLLRAGLVAAGLSLAVNDAGAVAASLCLALLWSRVFHGTTQKARPPLRQGTG